MKGQNVGLLSDASHVKSLIYLEGMFRHCKMFNIVNRTSIPHSLLLKEVDNVVHEGHLGVEREGVQDVHRKRLGWGLQVDSIHCCYRPQAFLFSGSLKHVLI